jgi:hypothetical protein
MERQNPKPNPAALVRSGVEYARAPFQVGRLLGHHPEGMRSLSPG